MFISVREDPDIDPGSSMAVCISPAEAFASLTPCCTALAVVAAPMAVRAAFATSSFFFFSPPSSVPSATVCTTAKFLLAELEHHLVVFGDLDRALVEDLLAHGRLHLDVVLAGREVFDHDLHRALLREVLVAVDHQGDRTVHLEDEHRPGSSGCGQGEAEQQGRPREDAAEGTTRACAGQGVSFG